MNNVELLNPFDDKRFLYKWTTDSTQLDAIDSIVWFHLEYLCED